MRDESLTRKRVLLVDDEPALLRALATLLRRQRGWDVTVAGGGREAIEQMANNAFDVIVTDLRMPAVNGIEVLEAARELQPYAGRIVFTGQSERSEAMATVFLAHRFVAKPCNANELERVMNEVCTGLAWQPRLPDRAGAAAVGLLAPTAGALVALAELLSRPAPSLGEVARVIEGDPALAAKVLQVAASGFFNLPRTPSSVSAAVHHLGLSVLRDLLDAFEARRPTLPDEEVDVEELADHAALTARLARSLIREPGLARDEAYLAGLLHEVGRLVVPGPDGPVLDEARSDPARTAACLLALWGLPAAVVEAVARHATAPALLDPRDPGHAVYLAHRAVMEQPVDSEGSASDYDLLAPPALAGEPAQLLARGLD